MIIFEDEKITFEIEINGELNIISAGGIQLESNWKIERFNTLEVSFWYSISHDLHSYRMNLDI